jgi:uncharacterized protein
MLQAVNVTRGTTLAGCATVADTSLSRFWGLLGRRGLDAGRGLWIKPSSGVHTLGMMFTIDVVGFDKDLRVIKLWKQLKPFRLTSVSLKVRSVLELPAGVIDATHTQLGDQLTFSNLN